MTQVATQRTSHPNVQIVERMYECFNRGDMNTIRNEIFAPDLIWRLPGHHPLSGTKNGADEVIAFFAQLNRGGIQVDLINIDAWGEDTVVEVHRGHGQRNGAVLDALNCTHYHIRDGKIADVQVYISDQHTVDQFFWAVYALKPIPDRLAS
ncbi:nuclear transport factor 2 family protein [Nostoc sp. CENA67]|uniref:Nuclear transport factor 2 family protein n=1 Tax=Amazonocrinis nigriterrae CENA67 TaxID=2794033 RepID=A0A8J7HZ99_9NOST|nr:nuclear transport factor 2 family protein [Amazonocrinis nigriterrae]MBH8566985.1 nuclear transport factor 2 family protein [Amazonocrinis nigriterrae CENA67]